MQLVWDETGKKRYETGTDRTVLFPVEAGKYAKGVAWSGIISVSQSPSGAESTSLWADNTKYLNLLSAEEFGGSINAYSYPDEWEECDGSKEVAPGVTIGQQARKTFGLCYRTIVGNDTSGQKYGYKLHIVYGALATPSEREYQTINDSPEAIEFSWEYTTTPVNVTKIPGVQATALLEIDSTKVAADKLKALEDILYGTAETESKLPMPDEIIELLSDSSAG